MNVISPHYEKHKIEMLQSKTKERGEFQLFSETWWHSHKKMQNAFVYFDYNLVLYGLEDALVTV